MRLPVPRRIEAVVEHDIVPRPPKRVRPPFELTSPPPPPADPVFAEYCDELTRNSAIDSMLMIRRATLSCFGSFTPVASTPSNVQLLSSTKRPTKRMEVCVPAPVLIAPGASIISLDQC